MLILKLEVVLGNHWVPVAAFCGHKATYVVVRKSTSCMSMQDVMRVSRGSSAPFKDARKFLLGH